MNLQAALKESLFNLVDSVQPPKRYKAVILDQRSRHIINLVMDKNELLNRHVANVLMLDEPRSSETYLEAVYIIEQSSFALGCIQADFTRVPPRYRAAHIFLLASGRASEGELTRFKNSAISRFITRIEPAPFAFLALEKQVFTLGCSSANHLLYNESCRQGVLEFVDLTGRQLANVCEVLGEYPYVRHSELWKLSRNNTFPRLVAAATVKHLEAARARYMTPELETAPRPTLLVLDRSVDLASPFLHDFGFQAMALDLLGNQFSTQQDFRTFTSKDGSTTGQLSEEDHVWVGLRHQHYVTATNELNSRLTDLKQANPHFADPQASVSVGDVRNMLAALPEFMKSRDNLTLNLEVAYELMAHVDKDPLRDIAEAEQIAALGSTVEGERHPDSLLTAKLVALLARKDVTQEMRLRLLALYVLYRETGLYATDYEKLRHHAALTTMDVATVQALEYLGHQTRKASEQASSQQPKSLLRENREQPLAFARVQPGLQTVMEQLLSHELDRGLFPFTGDEPNSEEEAMNVATSLRNPRQRATWAQNVITPSATSGSTETASAASKSKQKAKKRVLVFMLGGFTAAESAAMYRLSEAHPRTIILGGHDWLTPSKYLDFLSRIREQREKLRLPEDEPEPKIPAFLSASDRQNQKTAVQKASSPAGAAKTSATSNGPSGAPKSAPRADRAAMPQSMRQQKLEQEKNATPVTHGLSTLSLDATKEEKKEKKDKNMKSRFKGAFTKKK